MYGWTCLQAPSRRGSPSAASWSEARSPPAPRPAASASSRESAARPTSAPAATRQTRSAPPLIARHHAPTHARTRKIVTHACTCNVNAHKSLHGCKHIHSPSLPPSLPRSVLPVPARNGCTAAQSSRLALWRHHLRPAPPPHKGRLHHPLTERTPLTEHSPLTGRGPRTSALPEDTG